MEEFGTIVEKFEFIPKGKTSKFKFELILSLSDEYHWRITASNGKIIGASSERYLNKAECMKNLIALRDCIDEIESKL